MNSKFFILIKSQYQFATSADIQKMVACNAEGYYSATYTADLSDNIYNSLPL